MTHIEAFEDLLNSYYPDYRNIQRFVNNLSSAELDLIEKHFEFRQLPYTYDLRKWLIGLVGCEYLPIIMAQLYDIDSFEFTNSDISEYNIIRYDYELNSYIVQLNNLFSYLSNVKHMEQPSDIIDKSYLTRLLNISTPLKWFVYYNY
jgi:hypothetical protein